MAFYYLFDSKTNSNCCGGTSAPIISYPINTSKVLLSKFGNALTPSGCNNWTLGSNLSTELIISSTIIDAVTSFIFSKRDAVILEPKSGLKNFSPGKVKTIFLSERPIALIFLTQLGL